MSSVSCSARRCSTAVASSKRMAKWLWQRPPEVWAAASPPRGQDLSAVTQVAETRAFAGDRNLVPTLALPRLIRILPGLRRRQVACGELPVEQLAEQRLEVSRPLVLVVEVVGVLPQVDRQQRPFVADRQRIAVVGLLDRELVARRREPDPARGKMPFAAHLQFIGQRVQRAE